MAVYGPYSDVNLLITPVIMQGGPGLPEVLPAGPNLEDVFTPEGVIRVNGFGLAAFRVAYISAAIDAHHQVVLQPKVIACAQVSPIHNNMGPTLNDLERMSELLETDSFFINIRQFPTNSEQTNNIVVAEAIFRQVKDRLDGVIRRKERQIAANLVAHAPPPPAAALNARPVVARLRLKPGEGTKYEGPEGPLSLHNWHVMAETQFEYANNGANVPLSPLDKIVHLQSLLHPAGIIAMNTEKLKLAANDTKLTTYDFYSTAENKNDFSEFLKIDVFNRTNDKQLLRGEYDALVAKGYYTDPQQILRDLRHKQTLIGTQEADNMVTDNKILQDYLHVLPSKMREMVFNDKEFTAAKKTNNPAGNPPSGPVAACDIAMQVSMRAFDAAVATYPQGSLPARRQTNFSMLNSIASVGHDDSPNLDLLMNIPTNHAIRRAHQQSHDNHAHVNQLADRIASAVTEGIAGASNLRGEGSVNNDLCALCVGNGNDMDHYEDSLIAAVAESNFDKLSGSEHVGLNSLAQREYNAKKKEEMSSNAASSNPFGAAEFNKVNSQERMQRIRCYNCGKFGHYARDCQSPRSEQRTPFRRMQQRRGQPPLPRRGMIQNRRNVIPVNLFRKDQQSGRMFAMETEGAADIERDELVYAAEWDGGSDEFFIIA